MDTNFNEITKLGLFFFFSNYLFKDTIFNLIVYLNIELEFGTTVNIGNIIKSNYIIKNANIYILRGTSINININCFFF
jgi:hypothetical protein